MTTFLESIRAMQRAPRLKIVTAVKISFSEDSREVVPTCTYEISLSGARIPRINGIEKVDQPLWIHRKNLKARYRVVWIGAVGTDQANQVGVQLMEPANIIWEKDVKNQLC